MKGKNKIAWIEKGYETVSETGFKNLSIELIARSLNKSKSSFYHYFGDKEIFETELLDFHIERIKEFTQRVEACENVRPQLVELFLEYKTDLFFQKQIRFERDNPVYQTYLDQSFELFSKASIDLWERYFEVDLSTTFVEGFVHFFAENFLFKVSAENYTSEWIDAYVLDLRKMVRQMAGTKG